MNDAIDCAIMDIGLPDFKNISNIAALRAISINDQIKMYTGQSLTDDEQLELQNSADGIVIKQIMLLKD
jgi:DNA-binding response OmpR family regulator